MSWYRMGAWDWVKAILMILAVIAVVIGVMIGWTWCIWWALSFFHLINMPYTWEFAVAVLILSSLFGGIFRYTRR